MPKPFVERGRANIGPSFYYDGETYPYTPGGRVTVEFLLFSGEYATIRELLYGLVRAHPPVKAKLKRAAEYENVAAGLREVIEEAVALPRPKMVSDALEALDRISATDLRQLLNDLFRPRYEIPPQIPQWTFQEARNTCFALAQGRVDASLWQTVPGEVSVCYRRDEDPLEVKFVPSEWFRGITSVDHIKEVLGKTELETVLFFQILLNAVIEEGEVTVDLDSIIGFLGWEPESTEERIAAREKLWTWIRIFDSLHVIGRRRGFQREKEIHSEGPLLRIDNCLWDSGKYESSETPPIDVIVKPGEWLRRFGRNRSVCPYIGDLVPLREFPTGQPKGSWALSLALALNQIWRQNALKIDLERDSAASSKQQTRHNLLEMFPPTPSLDDVLNSGHPERAKAYWEGAIKLLLRKKVIESRSKVEASLLADRRVGWQTHWKDQYVNMTPPKAILTAIESIQKPKKKSTGKRSSKPSSRPPS